MPAYRTSRRRHQHDCEVAFRQLVWLERQILLYICNTYLLTIPLIDPLLGCQLAGWASSTPPAPVGALVSSHGQSIQYHALHDFSDMFLPRKRHHR